MCLLNLKLNFDLGTLRVPGTIIIVIIIIIRINIQWRHIISNGFAFSDMGPVVYPSSSAGNGNTQVAVLPHFPSLSHPALTPFPKYVSWGDTELLYFLPRCSLHITHSVILSPHTCNLSCILFETISQRVASCPIFILLFYLKVHTS